MYKYAGSLSATGEQKIREFVHAGGGYLGICGGAYFAASRVEWFDFKLPMESLSLFPGSARGPLMRVGLFAGISKIRRIMEEHPLSPAVPDSTRMVYWRGPALIPDKDANITVLAVYEKVNLPAVLAFEYGRGRVFLIGTHPEFAEGDEADGLTFRSLDVHDANWKFMSAAAAWCLPSPHQ
jgi:biotin--protein ligase